MLARCLESVKDSEPNKTSFKKGYIPWNKGKKLSEKHIENLRIAHIGIKPSAESIEKRAEKMRGVKHFLWKGNNVGYYALHVWIKRNWGKPNKCENKCKYPRINARGKLMLEPKRYEWSNITGAYDRNRENWQMLCPSCHRSYDYKFNIRKS